MPYWPYALNVEQAAAYVSLSETAFLTAMKEDEAPQPVWLTPRRKVWLRADLEKWVDVKAGKIPNTGSAQEWMDAV
ncbi:helix-turn-helix transcriptional regulator [Roseospira visakhapatnamensis]|uniref:Putative DNA-binding transcriptional regulator AlpA n=1 Tax=Roseospira visakhapatnamensis TaxID=390880 RepID=A0A7W6RGK7_9PROT|nr:AlpA family phage regulatory protein [Roseospira visakhapatnamensis]MBB4268196.1 putative DNA-binding transcriptional regulator AlpA [Roseospira visakhapatnamensis]